MKTRFNLRSLFMLTTVVALAIALTVSWQRDNLILVGGYRDTWELEKSVVSESEWSDKSKPPNLSISEIYEIASGICEHLNVSREQTGVGGWEPVCVSIERLQRTGHDTWQYFVQLHGKDYPEHGGQNVIQELVCMILMDKTVVFDSGSYSDKISQVMMGYEGVIDAAPQINARPPHGGGFF